MVTGHPRWNARRMVWCALALVAAIAVPLGCTAAPQQDAERHPPRALLTPGAVSALRSALADTPEARASWSRLAAGLPHRDPGLPWIHSQYGDLLSCAFVAAASPDGGDMLPFAKCLLKLACIQDQWCQPGNEWRPISLYTAETAAAVALAYDWLHDELSLEDRELVERALQRLAFEPYLRAVETKAYPLGVCTDNWCAVVNSGVGIAAAIMAEKLPVAAEIEPITRGEIVAILEELGRDGGWAEGLGYWGWVVESILRYGAVLNDLGMESDDILGHEALRTSSDFPLYLYLPPREYIGFGDSMSLGPSRTPLLRLAGLLRDGQLQWLAEMKRANLRWLDVLWSDDTVPAAAPYGLPLAKLFSNINWAVLRTGWDADAAVLAISSGARTAHSHLDANHILVHAFGETLLRDLGARGYPEGYFSEGGKARYYWSDTRGHNAILMDGLGQRTELGTGGQITEFLNGPHCDYVCSDATRAYPDKALKVLRHVVFVRPGYFLVIDDLAAKWKTRWQWLGQSAGEFSLQPQSCTIACSTAALSLHVIEPQGSSAEVLTHPGGERYVSFSPPGTPEKTRFAVVLYPWKRGEPEAVPLRCPAEFSTDRNEKSAGVTVVREDGTVDELRWCDSQQVADRLAIAVVSRDGNGQVVGFSGFSTAQLSYSGRPLLLSSCPLCISADIGPDGFSVTAASDAPVQDLRVWCPQEPVTVLIDGAQGDWSYNQATRQLCGRLAAGRHQVLAKFTLE